MSDRAKKSEIRTLLKSGDFDSLIDRLSSVRSPFRILQSLVYDQDEEIKWRAIKLAMSYCGYIHEGEEEPDKCPACAHPRAHFELLAENW